VIQLIARGRAPRQSLKVTLEAGTTYDIGRDHEADVPILWDPHVSRQHARLHVDAEHVNVEKLSSATNPIFFAGKDVSTCTVNGSEYFVIGATTFYVMAAASSLSSASAQPVEEVMFDQRELRKVRFRDAADRIDVLTHLPEVIQAARTDSELHSRLVNLLLAGIVHAEAVAIVGLDEASDVQVMHWDRRRETAGEFRPSTRLIEDAIGTRKRTVLHVWESHDQSKHDYTQMAEFDWAFCTPISVMGDTPWGMYVAGRLDRPFIDGSGSGSGSGSDGVHLQADVKFAELVAEIISSVQKTNFLERRQTSYRQFLAPTILTALGDDPDIDLLEPRLCDVTVLFCDLRGFSLRAEEAADDLLGLLDRVSRALGVMSHHISHCGGVTGDFQGDAALGFWGWPFASDDAPLEACRAALGIRMAFQETRDRKDHPLANFQVGIGIAHGRAVAGKIGTSEQVKITVFGPVVNLASRLEGMTKQLRVPIVMDESTVKCIQNRLDASEGRVRRLAKVLPYGMENSVFVSELLPPESECPELPDTIVRQYENAVDHFVAGRWDEAHQCLHEIPAGDRAQDFLGLLIAQHNRVAPSDWDGVVRLPSK